MRTLKLTIALAITLISASTAMAQDMGITVNRGMTTLCPDYKNFTSTISQGYGFGFFKYRAFKKGLFIKTGANITVLNSCKSVLNNEGTHTLIPKKYMYAHMPISIEKQFFKYNAITRSANHYAWSVGADFAYLMHENGYEQHVGSDFKTNPLNIGANASIQMVKPMAWKTAFAIGPQIQAFSTGQEIATVAFYAGVKMDWKFGNYFGKKR